MALPPSWNPRRPATIRERALRLFGADVRVGPGGISVTGGTPLTAVDITIPGDPSSAAFFAAAAAALPGSRIEIEGVGLNPTRIGLPRTCCVGPARA